MDFCFIFQIGFSIEFQLIIWSYRLELNVFSSSNLDISKCIQKKDNIIAAIMKYNTKRWNSAGGKTASWKVLSQPETPQEKTTVAFGSAITQATI